MRTAEAHGRSMMQLLDELQEQTEAFQRDPAHRTLRCECCHNFTKAGRLRETPTGTYEDSETLCGFCKAERNEDLGKDLRGEWNYKLCRCENNGDHCEYCQQFEWSTHTTPPYTRATLRTDE